MATPTKEAPMPFNDTAPQHRMREPTRAECDAADEAYAQEQAAQIGGVCYALADRIAMMMDKRPSEWRADSFAQLLELHRALQAAEEAARYDRGNR
jgi:hypothetical protein